LSKYLYQQHLERDATIFICGHLVGGMQANKREFDILTVLKIN